MSDPVRPYPSGLFIASWSHVNGAGGTTIPLPFDQARTWLLDYLRRNYARWTDAASFGFNAYADVRAWVDVVAELRQPFTSTVAPSYVTVSIRSAER